MPNDPLEEVFAFVERAYLRLQAGDILIRCFEESRTDPMQRMVESLVIAGPHSLAALQEILDEVKVRQRQLDEDRNQVLSDFMGKMNKYGVRLSFFEVKDLNKLTPVRLLETLRIQKGVEENTQLECLHLLRASREMVTSIDEHLLLLMEIENLLLDWVWGLTYQIAHQNQLNEENPDRVH
ncbi:MAG: hypothetical protein AB1345_02505 [Chloroflexota bacterium]